MVVFEFVKLQVNVLVRELFHQFLHCKVHVLGQLLLLVLNLVEVSRIGKGGIIVDIDEAVSLDHPVGEHPLDVLVYFLQQATVLLLLDLDDRLVLRLLHLHHYNLRLVVLISGHDL